MSDSIRPHPWRLRIGLAAFLIVPLVAGTFMLNQYFSARLAELTRENGEIKIVLGKVGELEPFDPHLMEMRLVGRSTSRIWKIYVPPGETRSLCLATQKIEESNFPAAVATQSLAAGIHTISFAIVAKDDVEDRVELKWGSGSLIYSFTDDEKAALNKNFSSQVVGNLHQLAKPGQRIELVRERRHESTAPFTVSGIPAPGVLIWIESNK